MEYYEDDYEDEEEIDMEEIFKDFITTVITNLSVYMEVDNFEAIQDSMSEIFASYILILDEEEKEFFDELLEDLVEEINEEMMPKRTIHEIMEELGW